MSSTLEIGATFAARYKVERRIAAGAMGTVYEVVHLETERRSALKVMHPHIVQDPEMRERFKLEARIAAHVESKYIVDVFDAGVDEHTGVPFLVMELLQGEELGKRLKRLGRFQPEEALTYLHQTALALDRTHNASIVHRDLKPGNLFLAEQEDDAPRIKVLDFGVAKLIAEGTTSGGATMTVGTPVYMSPEQFRSEKVTAAADIYALGMLAYTFLVGEAYWAREGGKGADIVGFALIAVKGPQELASVRAARKDVLLPPRFDAWFARATASSPELRFTTAMRAVSALAEVLGMPRVGASRPMVRRALPSGPGDVEAPVDGPAPVTDGQETTKLTVARSQPPTRRALGPAIPMMLSILITLLGAVAVYLLPGKLATRGWSGGGTLSAAPSVGAPPALLTGSAPAAPAAPQVAPEPSSPEAVVIPTAMPEAVARVHATTSTVAPATRAVTSPAPSASTSAQPSTTPGPELHPQPTSTNDDPGF